MSNYSLRLGFLLVGTAASIFGMHAAVFSSFDSIRLVVSSIFVATFLGLAIRECATDYATQTMNGLGLFGVLLIVGVGLLVSPNEVLFRYMPASPHTYTDGLGTIALFLTAVSITVVCVALVLKQMNLLVALFVVVMHISISTYVFYIYVMARLV